MTKIKASEFKDSYAKQGEGNFDRVDPVSGIYEVVNVKLQHQTVGQNATKKLRVITRVLRVVNADKPEEAGRLVTATFGFDLWWDLSKQFNAARLAYLGIACGETGEWDPKDDPALIETITGVPYQIKIEVTPREGRNGKIFHNVDVIETRHLSKDKRSKYVKDPGWKKIVGLPADRLLEPRDYSGGAAVPQKETIADPFDGPADDFGF